MKPAKSWAFATLWGVTAAMPALLIPAFGNGYTEPKLVALWGLGAVCGAVMIARLARGQTVYMTPFSRVASALLLLQLIGCWGVANWGLAFQSMALTAAAVSICMLVANSQIDEASLSSAVVPGTLVVVVGLLARIVFGKVLFSDYSPFGATLGLKNSVSVYLALVLPFVLLLVHASRAVRASSVRFAVQGALCTLLAIMVWVILANRTRSAWWMLLVYGATTGLAAWRWRRPEVIRLCWVLLGSYAVGALLLNGVPDSLRWRSETPYWESLSTLASLDRASGRKELWTVGLRMFSQYPVFGVGTGAYPAVWREFIAQTTVNPKAFAFLRGDLPIFNDYLQGAVESGFLAGLAGFGARAALPLYYFYRLTRSKGDFSVAVFLMCLATLGLAADAFFDSPFGRPETVLLFAVAMGLVERQRRGSHSIVLAKRWNAVLIPVTLGLVSLTAVMTTGLALRSASRRPTDPALLARAVGLWPWDIQWSHQYLNILLLGGQPVAAEQLVKLRLRAWPTDPESHYMRGILLEHQGQLLEAVQSLERSVLRVAGGVCYAPGYNAYVSALERLGGTIHIEPLPDAVLSACR